MIDQAAIVADPVLVWFGVQLHKSLMSARAGR
jgi:hypothetical protein